MITYPIAKIYVGKDSVGSFRYFGSPDIDIVNQDFANLPLLAQKKYCVFKEILWESEEAADEELSQKEIYFIRSFCSNNPDIGYNRFPPYKKCKLNESF